MSNAGFQCPAACQQQQQPGMTPREIRAELMLRGVTVKQIAAEAGVTSGAVTQTISQYNGNSFKGYRIRGFIARALGRTVNEIWPDHREVV